MSLFVLWVSCHFSYASLFVLVLVQVPLTPVTFCTCTCLNVMTKNGYKVQVPFSETLLYTVTPKNIYHNKKFYTNIEYFIISFLKYFDQPLMVELNLPIRFLKGDKNSIYIEFFGDAQNKNSYNSWN